MTTHSIATALACVAAITVGCPGTVSEADTAVTDTAADTTSEVMLTVNEVVVARADGGHDWIELYASGAEPVELARYALRDGDPFKPFTALPNVTLQPGDYVVVIASSGDPGAGQPWVDFKLGAEDAVVLALDGVEVQTLAWTAGEAPQSTSYGLVVNGDVAGGAGTLKPTPGAANEVWTGALPEELDLFVGDTIIHMELVLSPEDWTEMQDQPLAEKWFQGSLKLGGHTIEDIGIRTKSTTDLAVVHGPDTIRYSLRVDANRYVKGQRIDGRRGFVLNNNYLDPTFMRETLAYEAYRAAGLKAPKTQYVDLTVAGTRLGLYTLVELVDKEFVQDNFPDFDDGDLYEPELPAGTLQYAGDTPSDYPKMGLETNEDTSDGSRFVALVKSLHEDTFDSAIRVNETLRYIAISVLLGNLDSYLGGGTNFYLYDWNGQFVVLPWDLDQSFGTYDCGCGADAVLTLPIETPTCGPMSNRPMVAKLLASPDLLATYRTALTELVGPGGGFTTAEFNTRIEVLRSVIQDTVEADPTKLFTTADFTNSLDTTISKAVALAGEPDRMIPGLRPFIAARIASVQAQLAGTEDAAGIDGSICGP